MTSIEMTGNRSRVRHRRWFTFSLQMALHVSVLLAWEIACRTVIPPQFLPPPSAIAVAFVKTIQSGELQTQFGQTAVILLAGYGASVVCGLALGILMGSVTLVAKLLDPYVNALYAMPTVALVPLVVIWLGLGVEAKIFLTFIVGVFPIVISAQAGVNNIPTAYIDTARSFACTRRQILWKIIVPATVPFLVSGLRLGLGRALVGVVVAEMFTAMSGLGYMVANYAATFKTAYLFVPILTLAAFSIALTELLRWAERRMLPWNKS